MVKNLQSLSNTSKAHFSVQHIDIFIFLHENMIRYTLEAPKIYVFEMKLEYLSLYLTYLEFCRI